MTKEERAVKFAALQAEIKKVRRCTISYLKTALGREHDLPRETISTMVKDLVAEKQVKTYKIMDVRTVQGKNRRQALIVVEYLKSEDQDG